MNRFAELRKCVEAYKEESKRPYKGHVDFRLEIKSRIKDTDFNTAAEYLNAMIEAHCKYVELKIRIGEYSLAYIVLKNIKEMKKLVKFLDSKYVFTTGHSRIESNVNRSKLIESPASPRWYVACGKASEILKWRYEDELWNIKVHNSEHTVSFDTEEEMAKYAIKYYALSCAEIEDVFIKNNTILVKAKNKGCVIGKGGRIIRKLEELLGKRIKLI